MHSHAASDLLDAARSASARPCDKSSTAPTFDSLPKFESAAPFTPMEKRVLAYLAHGYIEKAIARELGISRRTVESHHLHLMKKVIPCMSNVKGRNPRTMLVRHIYSLP